MKRLICLAVLTGGPVAAHPDAQVHMHGSDGLIWGLAAVLLAAGIGLIARR